MLIVHGPLVHPWVPVPPRDEDGRPELPDVQVLPGRDRVRHHGQLHLQIPPSVNIRVDIAGVMNIHKVSPSHGHFYTIPTSSEIVADGQDGLWLTEFKGGKSKIIFLLDNQMMTYKWTSWPRWWTRTTTTGRCSSSAWPRTARTSSSQPGWCPGPRHSVPTSGCSSRKQFRWNRREYIYIL